MRQGLGPQPDPFAGTGARTPTGPNASGNTGICLSPKKIKLPVGEIHKKADELKVIVYNKHDLVFAEEQAAQVSGNCILYLQPEWSAREKVIPMIVDYVMQNPKWKVSLQTHKYLHIP